MSAGFFLLMMGLVIYAGVVGSWIYETRRIPDVLILILLGLLLGPVLGLVPAAALGPWMPFVGSIALSLILFEGGLDLDFEQMVSRTGLAFMLATITFFTSMISVAALYHWLAGAAWAESFLVGSVLGCVSSAVILPVTHKLRAPAEVKTAINLEAAFSDMWGVVITLVLLRVTGVGFDPGQTVNALIGSFTTAVIGAALFGAAWLWALERLKASPFAYMMTLAAVFVLYGLTELAHGSGPVAVLSFGVILTNAPEIAAVFRRKYKFTLDETIRRFNTEVTFFARTFYFVYLGLVVSLQSFDLSFLAVTFAIFAALTVCRIAVVRGSGLAAPVERPYELAYLAMIPRGLTSAVLAGMVNAAGRSDGGLILELTFAVILLTNFLMSFLVYRFENLSPEPAAGVAQS